jgi:transcriptional regulator of acetoin/glycerol metabolism
VGLERLEAVAILQAVQEADGNKHQAAAALGIARSTLYRKMRSLGVDMTSSRL